jgi:hypothetical protein
MSRYLASLAFAVVVAAAAAAPAAASPANAESATEDSTVAVQQVRVPAYGLRDEAAMVLVGTALIGLGAAVRRTA